MEAARFLSVLKNNWKKALIGVSASCYAIHYGKETLNISRLIKSYCKEASLYGENTQEHPKRIIVILNPAANKKKSEKKFRKYCEPVLHLAGFKVDIVRTDSEGYAKSYVEYLKTIPDAIVIAGGDGTVSEVLTGMMRRNDNKCPIALLPLGLNNDISKKYLNFSQSCKLDEAKSLLNAAICLVRGSVDNKSVMKIEQISEKDLDIKPIYALGYMQWGVNRDMASIQEKYWYMGKAKSYLSALLNAFNQSLSWNCIADIFYTPPCSGCSNCVIESDKPGFKNTWLTSLFFKNGVPSKKPLPTNIDCKKELSGTINSSNVRIYVDDLSEPNKIVLEKQESIQPGYSFLYTYLNKSGAPSHLKQVVECRTIKLFPDGICTGPLKSYSIDNEEYDVRPISLTLIPNAIQLYKQPVS